MKTKCVKNQTRADKKYHDCQCGKYAFIGNVCLCAQNQNDEVGDVPVLFMRRPSDNPVFADTAQYSEVA